MQKTSSQRRSGVLRQRVSTLKRRYQRYLERRPHRSFRRSRRRDYQRSMGLPGYWALSVRAGALLWRHRAVFLGLALVYAALMLLVSSSMPQDAYTQLREAVEQSREEGAIDGVAATMTVVWGVVISQLSGTTSGIAGSSQVMTALFGLYAWLAATWMTRALLAKHRPKVRDSLYNSGAPVVALLVLVLIALAQLLPAVLAVIIYGAADASGVLAQTIVLMLAGGMTILLVVLSLYWATSTMLAMTIVTLPGMYPLEALRLAGDVVQGRRMRLLLRLAWLLVLLALLWLAVLVPMIMLDGALKAAMPALEWLPLVPLTALGLLAVSIVGAAVYNYLLYRTIVESDDA